MILDCTLLVPLDCSYEITDSEERAMADAGVDLDDDIAVADFVRANLGKEVHGVTFPDLSEISEQWNTRYTDEIEIGEWWVSG